jgi:hypothetical protein
MRFMMLMIPNGYVQSAPGTVPPIDQMAEMSRYNDSLAKAGVLLAVDGLHPVTTASRVTFQGHKGNVTDGPFAEAKEVVGGYWLIDVGSKDEALEWARRCPAQDGDVIEVRQIQEIADFPPEIQAALSHQTAPGV